MLKGEALRAEGSSMCHHQIPSPHGTLTLTLTLTPHHGSESPGVFPSAAAFASRHPQLSSRAPAF